MVFHIHNSMLTIHHYNFYVCKTLVLKDSYMQLQLQASFMTHENVTEIHQRVCGDAQFDQIIEMSIFQKFIQLFFSHLKLEIVTAIQASNE